VVTDLLVLRRRDPASVPAGGPGWEKTVLIGGDQASPVRVNEYFDRRPRQVIGSIATRSGPYGPQLQVSYGGDTAAALRALLAAGVHEFTDGQPLFIPPAARTPDTRVTLADAPADALEDHLSVDEAGRFTVVSDGQLKPYDVPATQRKELTALLGLRDTLLALLNAEAATSDDTDQIAELRAQLNRRYDTYLANFGPINRVTTRRTGRVDPDTGEERIARIRPPQGRFREDPHSPAVYGLEHYDAETGIASKAAIFTERTIAPRAPRLGADTPEDAVAICLDTHGAVRLEEIARLLGTTEEQARTDLGRLVFNDPADPDRLIPAAEYLSGNVRVKLVEARDAAARDGEDRWSANIAALAAVVPADLTPAEITAQLGASWIGAGDVAAFLTEILDDSTVKVEHPGGSTWTVKGNEHTVLASTTFGTARASAIHLAQAALEQRR
jgi:N12 class adenine-specific DNA methylase